MTGTVGLRDNGGAWAERNARDCKFGTQQEQRIETPYEGSDNERNSLHLALHIQGSEQAQFGDGSGSGCLEPDNHHHFPAYPPSQLPALSIKSRACSIATASL